MSYDLAVWEGKQPPSDAAAGEAFERLMDEYQGEGVPRVAPSVAISRYVAALLERWPDITEADGEESPWADGPLINNAIGPIFYFAMVFSRADDASEFAAAVAREHGLVCFDPQGGNLR